MYAPLLFSWCSAARVAAATCVFAAQEPGLPRTFTVPAHKVCRAECAVAALVHYGHCWPVTRVPLAHAAQHVVLQGPIKCVTAAAPFLASGGSDDTIHLYNFQARASSQSCSAQPCAAAACRLTQPCRRRRKQTWASS